MIDRKWLSKQIALNFGATVLPHSIQLVTRFDTFRGGCDAETVSEIDHRFHNGSTILRSPEVPNKRLINLYLVKREEPQIT